MPKVILFEMTSRVFVRDHPDGFKVYFEDIPRVFTHGNTKGFICNCGKINCSIVMFLYYIESFYFFVLICNKSVNIVFMIRKLTFDHDFYPFQ